MDSCTITIPEELFAEAESSLYSDTITCKEFTQGGDVYHFDKPLAYTITITNTSDALLVMGTIAGTGHCACARCLEDAVVPINGEVEGYVLLPNSTRELTEEEEEEYFVLGEDHVLDLAPMFSAAISLALPLIPLCDEDCLGLCPTCGKNLNEGLCECEQNSDDEDAFANNPFAVLRNYSFEDTSENA